MTVQALSRFNKEASGPPGASLQLWGITFRSLHIKRC